MRDITLIKDPNIRNALETLVTEIENLECTVQERNEEIADGENEYLKLEARIEELEAGIHGLNEKIKELEVALAEAYLTDEISEV